MPYCKSRARKSFDVEIGRMEIVIRDTFSNKTVTQNTKEHVLSSCIMLASAKVEVYFEDFFDGWIDKVKQSGLTNKSLPQNLRAMYLNQNFLNNAFKKLIIDNNESHYIDAVVQQWADHHFHLIDDLKPIPNLSSKKIYQNRKYPSPQNLKALFKRIGINNVFDSLNRSAKTNTENLLQSFNDFRTTIAHSGIPPGINDRDVIKKLVEIRNLIYHIDKVLYWHIYHHTTKNTWMS